MMGGLFRKHPEVVEYAVKQALNNREYSEAGFRLDKLHQVFLSQCRAVGIKENEYPFSVVTQGKQAFARLIRQVLEKKRLRGLVNVLHGEDIARKLGDPNDPVRVGALRYCLERVEFDAHRLDFLAVIEVPDPAGGEPAQLVLDRFWILVIIDVSSRAILGYHVSLSEHYTQEDVLLCIENALLPWKPRTLSIEGLSYPTGAGFPSGTIPELAFAKWAEFAFDNDRSNCATRVWDRLKEKIGCILVPGPVRSPERRQVVERFFRTLEQNGFQRLQNTTGASPRDPRRRNPEQTALRYDVRLEEMLDLIDVLLAAYNAEPSTALYGRSPLEHLAFALGRKSFFVRNIPESERASFCLTTFTETRVVRGSLRNGKRPYVEFEGARYFSEKLSSTPSLVGKQLLVECNARDLRRLRAFYPTGDEFDILTVTQAWAYHAHDLRTRRAILKCLHSGRIRRRDHPDPVKAFMLIKTREASRSKKARNVLAHAMLVNRRIAEPVVLPPAQPIVPAPAQRTLHRTNAPLVQLRRRTLNF